MVLLLSDHYNPTYSSPHHYCCTFFPAIRLCKQCRDPLWGPPSCLHKWLRGSLASVKRPGREAYHSPPSGVEVKNEWSCNSTPPIRRHSMNRKKFIIGLCNFQSFHSRCVSSAPQPHRPKRTSTENNIFTASSLIRVIILPDN